jgi:arabinofuranosyltransferase
MGDSFGESANTPSTGIPLPRPLALLLLVVFLVITVRTVWVADDAEISLRTVLNVTHGFGLTYNIDERVQTFTHPLWLLLLTAAYLVAGNVFVATMALSVVVSAAVFWLAITRAASPAQAGIAAVVLFFSRAFVDFSVAGLENPLVHLIAAVFVGVAIAKTRTETRWLAALWELASLMYLTRPDAMLLVLPAALVVTARRWQWRRVSQALAIGLAPAAAWTLFALFYYGLPFPNTAYAKIANGISRSEMWQQGWLYLVDSLDRDPLTLATIGLAVAVGLLTRGVARAMAAGLVLYVVYVASIGGDFMAGRFLTAPLFVSVLVLSRLVTATPTTWYVAGAVLTLVGSAGAHVPLWTNSRFDDTAIKPNGTVDERAVYIKDRSLALARRQTFRQPGWPTSTGATITRQVVEVCGLLGRGGIEQGPYVHMLDECALADPLLARLPAIYNDAWRPGHFRRLIPAQYRESLASSANLLEDRQLAAFYDELRSITRGPLWSTARLGAIWKMNLGRFDHLIDRSFYRHAGVVARLKELANIKAAGTPPTAEGNRLLDSPLTVLCEDRSGRRYIDVSVDSDDRYFLVFLKNERHVATLEFGPVPDYRRQPGLTILTLDLPPAATAEGFDAIVINAAAGDDPAAIGHLLLDGYGPTDGELARRVAERDAPRSVK